MPQFIPSGSFQSKARSDHLTVQQHQQSDVNNAPSYPSSSSSFSRTASPTPEVYALLYDTLTNRAHSLADELERDGSAQEEAIKLELVNRQGEKMKRKRSSSLDKVDRVVTKAIKVKVEEDLAQDEIWLNLATEEEKSGIKKEKAEQSTSTTLSHRRRSSLPSLPKAMFTPSTTTRIYYKKPLFSLDTFLREANSATSSTQTSPVLAAAQLPLPLQYTSNTISIPLSRSQSTGIDYQLFTNSKKIELSSVVRKFEQVLKERAEGWKRLEEVQERQIGRNIDDWNF